MAASDEVRWLDDDERRAWLGLMQVLQLLPLALDRQLRAEAGIPHTYYSVLAVLSQSPDQELRMSRLAALTATSLSRLSHSVARLEERGWVQRRSCSDDGRGAVAALTVAGQQALAAAAPGHVAEVRRRVFDLLEPQQVEALAGIATALAEGLTEQVCPTTRTTDSPHQPPHPPRSPRCRSNA